MSMVPEQQLSSELREATEIARRAGAILLRYFGSEDLRTEEKQFLDVVTAADKESERDIVRRLREAFPEDAIVGEEGTQDSSETNRSWYVDPLDGTFNFSRGLPFWCVSIGLAIEDEPRVGVVFDPLHDDMFTAIKGAGAWLNGSPIQVAGVDEPLRAVVQITVKVDRSIVERSLADTVAVGREVMRLRNMGALALELCYVACGRLDGLAQRGSHPWDYAAAVLVLSEAGGVVSDLDGSPFSLFTDNALAAGTPTLHRKLHAMMRPEPAG